MDSEFRMRRWAIAALALLRHCNRRRRRIRRVCRAASPCNHRSRARRVLGRRSGGSTATPYPYLPVPLYGPWRFGFFGPLLTIFLFVFLFRTLAWGFGGWDGDAATGSTIPRSVRRASTNGIDGHTNGCARGGTASPQA
jgi:hypothetical protein